MGVQFYRQKPIGDYIADFHAPKARLVVEVDGSQHMEKQASEKERIRDEYLRRAGLQVIRFDSRQVLERTESVLEVIYRAIAARLEKSIG